MQPSNVPIETTRLHEAWERFVDGGELTDGLDPAVALSWQRCAPRLNPRKAPHWTGLRPLTSAPQSLLRLVARPVMEDLFQFTEGAGGLLVLTDSACTVLELLGDPDLEAAARALGLKPGVFLDEGDAGTNAFSLALTESFPSQVVGPEHFLEGFHAFQSAAAPLHDAAGKPVGTLGLLRRQAEASALALGMVVAAAKAIEGQLHAQGYLREANAQATEFNATMDAISEGILAWTGQGIVTHVNGRGGELLGIKPSQVVGRPLIERISLPESVARCVARQEELNDVEARFRVDGEKRDLSVSMRIIRHADGGPAAFITTLRPVRQVHQLANQVLGSQAWLTLGDLVGQSPVFQEVRRQAEAAVEGEGCVLLTGEQGTGKNALAQAIHNHGSRATGPFLSINGHALPREHALEAFLGFEPAALPDAMAAGQPSKFELAEGGTLFIEEIDALPLEVQAILANLLTTGHVTRLGGKRAIPVHVRVMASTEVDLAASLRAGSFREDLLRQLSAFSIHLPPLRERAEDIPLLLDRCLERLRGRLGTELTLSEEARARLQSYAWPGNIAELESVVELASFNADGGSIAAEHLVESLRGRPARPAGSGVPSFSELEKRGIEDALAASKGNMSQAARMLAISRNTLYRKLKEHGIGSAMGIPRPIQPLRKRRP